MNSQFTISLPYELNKEIHDYCKKNDFRFSEFVRTALKEEMKKDRKRGVTENGKKNNV